jgi:hypothetical protein
MAVLFSRIEAGIYRIQLDGTVPLNDLLNAQQQGTETAAQEGDARYVLIIEIASSVRMPFDIREAGRLIENDTSQRILTVGAGLHVRFLAGILGRLFGLNRVEHVSSVDQAVIRARAVLQAAS